MCAVFVHVQGSSPSREMKSGSAGPTSATTISQRSMSTTNLTDRADSDKRPSVASTNQAASAESLQHQTPSLENLLARSRIFDDRIPEVVADEAYLTEDLEVVEMDLGNISANNNRGFAESMDSFDSVMTIGGTKSSSDRTVSARVVVGGSDSDVLDSLRHSRSVESTSQPASDLMQSCNTSKTEDVSAPPVFGSVDSLRVAVTMNDEVTDVDTAGVSSNAPCTPSDNLVATSEVGTKSTSLTGSGLALAAEMTEIATSDVDILEETNAKNLANLSMSAPDLIALRQHQQSVAVVEEDALLVEDDFGSGEPSESQILPSNEQSERRCSASSTIQNNSVTEPSDRAQFGSFRNDVLKSSMNSLDEVLKLFDQDSNPRTTSHANCIKITKCRSHPSSFSFVTETCNHNFRTLLTSGIDPDSHCALKLDYENVFPNEFTGLSKTHPESHVATTTSTNSAKIQALSSVLDLNSSVPRLSLTSTTSTLSFGTVPLTAFSAHSMTTSAHYQNISLVCANSSRPLSPLRSKEVRNLTKFLAPGPASFDLPETTVVPFPALERCRPSAVQPRNGNLLSFSGPLSSHCDSEKSLNQKPVGNSQSLSLTIYPPVLVLPSSAVESCRVQLEQSNIAQSSRAAMSHDVQSNQLEFSEASEASASVVDESSSYPAPSQPYVVTSDSRKVVPVKYTARRGSTRGGIRSRLGGYADVLRAVMQQMNSPGGPLSGFDLEDIEDDIYDDDMQLDGNEDECDDDFPHGLSVEAFAQAESALRRQSSSGSTGSGGEVKLNWKQIVMSESSRVFGDRGLRSGSSNTERKSTNGEFNRSWNDDFVLKRQFTALIPAFDPRPGRTNVNQTQDVELPPVVSESTTNVTKVSDDPSQLSEARTQTKLRLYIHGPNLANIENETIELDDKEATVFSFIQKLVQSVEWGQKNERTRRIWEPTYTLLYEDASDEKEISNWKGSKLVCPGEVITTEVVQDTLNVLSKLRVIGEKMDELDIGADLFVSDKLTQKLMQELADPLVVAAGALPLWCKHLVYQYPGLFSIDTRNNYLHATAFGTSRAIVWLQARRDQILENSRGATSSIAISTVAGARREDHYPEFRVGRIKHERIRVPRDDEQLLEYAVRVLNFHSARKAVLEIEYIGEEGTGLGPTLEFYALVAAEFQRKSLALWLCDDSDVDQVQLENAELDLGEGVKAPGYYVRRAGGLFPASFPNNSEQCQRAAALFRVLGIFLAKVLQDCRLVDLPLSKPFLKLMTSRKVVEDQHPCLKDVLSLDDLEEISPMKGRVLKELSSFVVRKRAIENAECLDRESKRRRLDDLKININGTECRIEDLGLTFSVDPPSKVFTYGEVELIEGGSNIDVTEDNVQLYIDKCKEFYLEKGIQEQVAAFREGFDLVFPLRSLQAFKPAEIQILLSGEQCPDWTREDIINYTEPKLGFTKESPGFLRFVDVLVGMNAAERKSFLQFTTGCSSLPPGGLANLHPRLTIVRKVDSGDGSYPSVNTCVHYLKLPDYSSTEIMRERLITATIEKGFHLN
ncbi:hypothetical protein AB6A40_003506 [Gnathostoma spinigerum]|uniref:E3 ubiquitin-protein ligase n=1 Tax=Gnathostoma spinigerum TaxID=75299 RepID=A0ABD6EC10_9BILA